MIDFLLGTPEFQVVDADIDHTVFPPDEGCEWDECDVYHHNEPIDCQFVSSGLCITRDFENTGISAANTVPYSDHWAVWTRYVLMR